MTDSITGSLARPFVSGARILVCTHRPYRQPREAVRLPNTHAHSAPRCIAAVHPPPPPALRCGKHAPPGNARQRSGTNCSSDRLTYSSSQQRPSLAHTKLRSRCASPQRTTDSPSSLLPPPATTTTTTRRPLPLSFAQDDIAARQHSGRSPSPPLSSWPSEPRHLSCQRPQQLSCKGIRHRFR